jgi:hypothetical protein
MAGAISDWSAEFEDTIELPNGRRLITLRDAAEYITKLPEAEHVSPEWQAAMEALVLVAEHGGPTMLPHIGVLKALNRHRVREFNSIRKETHWGKRKLKRDPERAVPQRRSFAIATHQKIYCRRIAVGGDGRSFPSPRNLSKNQSQNRSVDRRASPTKP